MKVVVTVAITLALMAAAVAVCVAEDSDRVRYYLHLRGQDTNPLTDVHDHWGLSLGANLGRYWGLELSADTFERSVKRHGQTLGEYGIGALGPQLRLRYPFLGDRLVPYVVGGVGVGFSEFNDRKRPAFGVPVKDSTHVFPVGTIGAGLEYYVADNIALGVEFKYVVASDQTLTVGGAQKTQRVDSLLTTLGVRLLVPELRPQPLAEARDVVPTRLYVGLRYGSLVTTNTRAFPGLELRPEPAAFFSAGTQFFGAALGLNFGRYLGVEFAAEGYEAILAVPGVGSVTEVGVGHFIPYLRLRYPLGDGRVVPYVFGGVGLTTVRTNDTKAPGRNVNVDIESNSWGAAGGVGVEYFVASNIALGVEARYMTARDHTAEINNGPDIRGGHFDAVVIALTLRAVLATFGK